MGFWGWFYIVAVVATLLNGHLPIDPLKRRQHAAGSEILAGSWVAAYYTRAIFNDPTPLVASSIIDVITSGIFLFVAMKNKAIWAALCVIIYSGMGMLHLAYKISGEGNELGYIWILNSLFFMALLTVNTAIMAGKHAWGAVLDNLRYPLRDWTFTGLRRPRGENHQAKA